MIHLKHCHILLLFALFLLPFRGEAQQELALPRLEQLSSQHVTQVIQDSEGFLWYATEGGGWLQTAIATVEKNISDEHYSVEQLSADLCMSRMTFYRKIQSATGQKPTEFIRTIRLRRAAELLNENRMTITEISYATGFSSVSYFSRCFRTMFGVPPTQFSEESA